MVFAAQVIAASAYTIWSILAVLILNLCALLSPILGVGGLGLLVASFFLPDPAYWATLGGAALGGGLILMAIQTVLEGA